MTTTPLLALEELEQADPVAHIKVNTALRLLEIHSKRLLLDITLTTPPPTPVESAAYWIAGTGTDEWTGHDDEIACYVGGGWYYFGVPDTGERWYDAGGADWLQWNGSGWTVL